MKKIFLLSVMLLFLSGCSSIKDEDLTSIINETINSNVKTLNVSRKGYKYYLPKGLIIRNSDNYNEVISNDKYTFYLYVDIVSYYNNVSFDYKENEEAYYSKMLNYNGKLGYVEINNYKNEQYLIEIMYNYAKIEVIGYEEDINTIVAYLMSIITSITYNDNIISNYLSNGEIISKEENFDIFEIVGSDNYLQFTTDEEVQDEIRDSDYIK